MPLGVPVLDPGTHLESSSRLLCGQKAVPGGQMVAARSICRCAAEQCSSRSTTNSSSSPTHSTLAYFNACAMGESTSDIARASGLGVCCRWVVQQESTRATITSEPCCSMPQVYWPWRRPHWFCVTRGELPGWEVAPGIPGWLTAAPADPAIHQQQTSCPAQPTPHPPSGSACLAACLPAVLP